MLPKSRRKIELASWYVETMNEIEIMYEIERAQQRRQDEEDYALNWNWSDGLGYMDCNEGHARRMARGR